MKILLIKTSSLGDVLHTFPAVTDLAKRFPNLELTWVVEEAFASMAKWHPFVKKILPVAIRRWRRSLTQKKTRGEIRNFIRKLRAEKYDLILDAQGLLKSSLIALFARGKRCGLDRHSAREPLASLLYSRRYRITKDEHAITRTRLLFAAAMDYTLDFDSLDYGITVPHCADFPFALPKPYVVFLHATTWITKLYPETYWQALIEKAIAVGYSVVVPWGNAEEQARSERLVQNNPQVICPAKLHFEQLAWLLQNAVGVISVDTGIGHLAAALSVPTVSLYGPTNPKRTGTLGSHQVHLAAEFECAPCLQKQCTYRGVSEVTPACFQTLSPNFVWEKFTTLLGSVSVCLGGK